MQPSHDEAFNWIRVGRDALLARNDRNWRGNFVSHLLPTRFEAYAKILHSIEANYTLIDDPNPLIKREIEILNVPACTELRSFVENLRNEGRGPRIRWAALAELIGVPFEPEICHAWFRKTMREPLCWPRFLYGPGEGILDAEEIPAMISLLRAFTGTQDCSSFL